jgi:hypothetical protein
MANPFEDIGAKGAGKVKGAVAAIKGLHGVFNVLVQEHTEASMLLTRAKAAKDPEKRLELWSKIRIALLSHERAELRVVYPELADHPETKRFAEQHEEEAGRLETAIAELDGVDAGAPAWLSHLEELMSLVKQHVDEEENEFFPEAAEVIGSAKSRELEQRFLAQKESLADQLH